MNSEQQWWTDVNSSCLHPWPFLAMQSYSLYYYYFVSVVISLFCLDTVPPSFIFRYLYISYNFFLKKIQNCNELWTACHPCVCVKCFCTSRLWLSYCNVSMQVRKIFFTGNWQNIVGVAALCTCELTCLGLVTIVRQVSRSLAASNADLCRHLT